MRTQTVKFENKKYATAARVLGHKDGASIQQLTKALKPHGVKTERQARLVIDRMRYGHGLQKRLKNTAPGRFKLA